MKFYAAISFYAAIWFHWKFMKFYAAIWFNWKLMKLYAAIWFNWKLMKFYAAIWLNWKPLKFTSLFIFFGHSSFYYILKHIKVIKIVLLMTFFLLFKFLLSRKLLIIKKCFLFWFFSVTRRRGCPVPVHDYSARLLPPISEKTRLIYENYVKVLLLHLLTVLFKKKFLWFYYKYTNKQR